MSISVGYNSSVETEFLACWRLNLTTVSYYLFYERYAETSKTNGALEKTNDMQKTNGG